MTSLWQRGAVFLGAPGETERNYRTVREKLLGYLGSVAVETKSSAR